MEMKLAFIVTAFLVNVQVFCYPYSSDNSEMGMKSVYDRIAEEALLSLTNAHNPPRNRQKRDLSSAKQSLEDSGVYRLISIKPVTELCHPAIRTLFIDVPNTTYAVCVSEATVDTPAILVVGRYEEHTFISILPEYKLLVDPTDVAAFYLKNYLYIVVTDRERKPGTELLKINLQTGLFGRLYDIDSLFGTSVVIWEMKQSGYTMAIANSDGYKDDADLSTDVYIYFWKDTYFDKNATISAFDVKDIEPFHIHGMSYIAIANFRRGKNNPQVDSEIFRYNIDGSTWKSSQKIRTYGAMDWEFFTLGTSLGKEFFLAVANYGHGDSEAKSMIYKYVDDKFVPFQCLQTTKATSIASFSSDQIFVLAVANENDAVHLYQYDGWRFIKSIQLTSGALSTGVVHLNFHRVVRNAESSVILSVSNPRHPNYKSVFEMGFVYENLLNDFHSASTDWCLKVLSKIEGTDIDKSIGKFDDVIFTDQETITINGDVVFEDGFRAETVKTPRLKVVSTEETFDDRLLVKLASLKKRLEAVKQKLDGFGDILKKALKVEGNQNITTRMEFQDATFDCKNHDCRFKNIYTNFLNGEDISDWSNQLIFLDKDQFINGTLFVDKINATSVHVHGLIDGINSQNFVTKSGDHNITGHKIFNDSIKAQDIEVSGKVDGVRISPDNVLLTTGLQTIYGNLSFDDVQTTWLKTTYVNGRDFTGFFNDLVFTDRPLRITGEKTFGDVTINELEMSLGSTINGVDFLDLWKNTLWKDGNQEIKAEITFSDVLMEKNLYAQLGVNGIQIPGPRIVDISEPATITGANVFVNTTKIGRLNVLESLNGVSLVYAPDGSKELDILLKSGNQIVTGAKTFHTIHLGANSDVYGTVDGVDLSEFRDSVLRKNESIVTDGTWIFNNLVIKGPLTVNRKISGIDLKDVYSRALKLNDSQVSEVVFNEYVFIEDLQSDDINGLNISNDLVLKNKFQILTGKKVFNEIVLEENSRVLGFVNNMNLSFFNEIIIRIGNQTLKSKIFKRNLKMKDLTVTGSINNIPVSDIVTLKGGKISGFRKLSNVTFSKLEAKNVEVTGRVNNIDLKEMIEDTMTYDDYQPVTGKKTFKGTIFVNGSNLQTSDLNGIDLKQLWSDAVFIDQPQTITGEKRFEDNVVFEALSFDSTFDGVTEWDIRYNWMKKNASQVIEGNVEFKNGFSAKDLTVGNINGIDIKLLESEIVKVNEATEIEGPIIFEKNVISNGDISLTGKVQSIDLSEEAVMRDSLIVTGEKKFMNDIVIQGDLTVDGRTDGIYVEDLCKNTILGNKQQNISRLVIKGDVTFLEGGTIGGKLAGVDLKWLEEIAVKNDGSQIKFTGQKNFSHVTFEGPVTVKGKIGGVDLKELTSNYMSLTRDQKITENMQFEDLAFKGVLSAENLDTQSNEINGVNLHSLNGRILKTIGTQNVTAAYHIDEIIFNDDVFVAGKVNGFDIPSGLMRHNHTNYIQSPKIFEQDVIVLGDLEMETGKTIQGVDVSDWKQKAVLTKGEFEIHGYKIFHRLYLNDVRVEGTLDGLKISEDSLLMTYGNQVITGRKNIVGRVNIEGSLTVDGLINKINLADLSRETLQRDRNNNITGLKHFTQPLTIVSLQAPAVAGVDVIKLQRKLNTSLSLDFLENRLDEIEGVVSLMKSAFENQAVLFQYYELFDEFSVLTGYNWQYVSGMDCGELLLLSDSSSPKPPCSSIRIFGYDKNSKLFMPAHQELLTSYAVSVKSLVFRNSTYLFVANQNPNYACSSNADIGKSTTDVYTWDVVSNTFKKSQSITAQQPSDMVAFKDRNKACIVILAYDGSIVHCATEDSPSFSRSEVLLTTAGQKASVIKTMGKIILAIVAEGISDPRQNYIEGQKSIDIYLWNSEKAEFSLPKQVLQSTFAYSVQLMSYKEKYSEKLFLAVAEASIPKIYNEPRIIIYRYEESSKFHKFQEIKDFGILEWISLNTGELLFFAVNSIKGQIGVYQYKGASDFVKLDTIKSLGTTALHAFVRSDPDDWLNHYLALVGPRALMAQPTQGVDYVKILKSKVKGKRPFY